MSSEDFDSEAISKRIRQLGQHNEILSHGVAELEALLLSLYSGQVANKLEATANAFTLKEKNQKLAHAINRSLQDLDQTLKLEMEKGTDVQVLVHEFMNVLRDSIRIFHDYRTVQGEFKRQKKKPQAKITLFGNNNGSNSNQLPNGNRNLMLTFRRFMKTFCICGGFTSTSV